MADSPERTDKIVGKEGNDFYMHCFSFSLLFFEALLLKVKTWD